MPEHKVWTADEAAVLWKLYDRSFSYKTIAQEITTRFGIRVTRNGVRNYIRRHPKPIVDEFTFEIPGERRKVIDQTIQFDGSTPMTILSLSDLHAPLINWRLFNQIISEADSQSICVVNGDGLDQECISGFDRITEHNMDTELNCADKIFGILTGKFEKVIYNQGNHERRILKLISKMPNGIKAFAANRINPMKWLEEKYYNLVCNYDWWFRIGQVIFAHPDEFSTVPMRTVQNVCDHFIALNEPFQGVVIGHTHKQGQVFYKNRWLAETGHLSIEPDYYKAHVRKDTWQAGYAVIYLDGHGNMDFQRSRCIPLKGVI